MNGQPVLRPPERSPVENAWLVSKREFGERVRSRLFFVSTVLLAVLAVVVSLTPVLIKIADRGTTTMIAVASDEEAAHDVIDRDPRRDPQPEGHRRASPTRTPSSRRRSRTPRPARSPTALYDAVLIATRRPTGQIAFQLLTGERIGADRVQLIQVGTLAIGIFDWIKVNGGGVAGAVLHA